MENLVKERMMRGNILLLAIVLISAGCVTSPESGKKKAIVATSEEGTNSFDEVTVLTEALMLAKQNYVQDFSYRELVYSAIDGMLQELDSNSSFLPPEPLVKLEEETSGEFYGVGLTVNKDETGVKVISPIDNSPAFRAGIHAGDTITAVNGKKVAGESLQEIVKRLRGEKGSEVKLTVHRENGEKMEIPVRREEIKLTAVKNKEELGDGIGYVRIAQFNEKVPNDFSRVLKEFQEKKLTGLIVDLRDNPGGLLQAAVGVAEQLLPYGTEIVQIKGRRPDGNPVCYKAGKCEIRETKMSVAVLVNGSSASASEIVAGALKAHRRAVLVGELTYGKASVQNVIHMRSRPDCALRLTTAYYYTPDGKCIHDKGIQPDISVPLSMAEWRSIQNRRLIGKQKNVSLRDPQLDRARDVLKGVLTLHK